MTAARLWQQGRPHSAFVTLERAGMDRETWRTFQAAMLRHAQARRRQLLPRYGE